ncbi:hypothetical protein PAXINDRAFT_169234 [Paxillus involutus ATCC 200175]|uniref:Unplaced genomic scaffold PAXINscaffold_15, whole genome shotgun sequence n=1 Tax=Paxillus involutus ATCC 200175 TaxID=664439 RepID=A0A0C9TYJ7_PAXIN|nr:hypothetical protein PAXINDRAFT_169234 [Paxillus involutus ATCC 200175]
MLGRILLAAAALASVASAQLTITNPSANSWWVAQSANTLAWTCNTSPYQTYTVVLTNTNPSILSGPLAIIAIQQNYDCSETITQQQSAQPAATGYTIQLTNPLNNTEVYAESEPFEIKALGSAYPASSSSAAASATGSGTSTSTGASAASTTGAAVANYIPVGMSMVAALALGLVVA